MSKKKKNQPRPRARYTLGVFLHKCLRFSARAEHYPKGANSMITIGKHPEMSHDELQAYWEHANRTCPDECGTVDIEFDGEFADLTYNFKERRYVPFQRIRRITGYLVGDLGRFNNAKRSEVKDRVKHTSV